MTSKQKKTWVPTPLEVYAMLLELGYDARCEGDPEAAAVFEVQGRRVSLVWMVEDLAVQEAEVCETGEDLWGVLECEPRTIDVTYEEIQRMSGLEPMPGLSASRIYYPA